MNEKLIDLINEFEGCRTKAYLCPAGKWTIGYGVTGQDIKEGTEWSQEKCNQELLILAKKYENMALNSSPILTVHSESRRAAIADFVYNLGIGNYNKSALKRLIDSGKWTEAAKEILQWDKVAGQTLPGLHRRRIAESKLLV